VSINARILLVNLLYPGVIQNIGDVGKLREGVLCNVGYVRNWPYRTVAEIGPHLRAEQDPDFSVL
jgi:hypothetical protein